MYLRGSFITLGDGEACRAIFCSYNFSICTLLYWQQPIHNIVLLFPTLEGEKINRRIQIDGSSDTTILVLKE